MSPPFAPIIPAIFLPSRHRRAGFSLVEITLAIGIIAFAFVGLLGLLPAGLTTFRQAMDTAVGAQIAQRIAGEVQETDYATLLKHCEPNLSIFRDSDAQVGLLPGRFFDDQGNEIKVADPKNVTAEERLKILYEVVVRVSRAPRVPVGSAANAGRAGSKNLATLTIQVANNPTGAPLPLTAELLIDSAVTRVAFQTFPALIARNSVEPELVLP